MRAPTGVRARALARPPVRAGARNITTTGRLGWRSTAAARCVEDVRRERLALRLAGALHLAPPHGAEEAGVRPDGALHVPPLRPVAQPPGARGATPAGRMRWTAPTAGSSQASTVREYAHVPQRSVAKRVIDAPHLKAATGLPHEQCSNLLCSRCDSGRGRATGLNYHAGAHDRGPRERKGE